MSPRRSLLLSLSALSALTALFALPGCAGMHKMRAPGTRVAAANHAALPRGDHSGAAAAAAPSQSAAAAKGQRAPAQPPNDQRYVIYRARLTLAVFKRAPVLARAQEIARRFGGYMTSLSDRSVTLRVPSSRLHAALAAFGALGEPLGRNISGEDVTAQYLDLEIRLKNALAVRARLVALLAKAKSVKDSVLIEKELGRVTEQIERLKGRLAYLKKNVAYSTVTLELEHKRSARARALRRRLPFRWVREVSAESLLRGH